MISFRVIQVLHYVSKFKHSLPPPDCVFLNHVVEHWLAEQLIAALQGAQLCVVRAREVTPSMRFFPTLPVRFQRKTLRKQAATLMCAK